MCTCVYTHTHTHTHTQFVSVVSTKPPHPPSVSPPSEQTSSHTPFISMPVSIASLELSLNPMGLCAHPFLKAHHVSFPSSFWNVSTVTPWTPFHWVKGKELLPFLFKHSLCFLFLLNMDLPRGRYLRLQPSEVAAVFSQTGSRRWVERWDRCPCSSWFLSDHFPSFLPVLNFAVIIYTTYYSSCCNHLLESVSIVTWRFLAPGSSSASPAIILNNFNIQEEDPFSTWFPSSLTDAPSMLTSAIQSQSHTPDLVITNAYNSPSPSSQHPRLVNTA